MNALPLPDPTPRALQQLARAARTHGTPVHLCTGHFAPPNTHAVWHLVTSADNVVQVVWHEASDAITARIPRDTGGRRDPG